jgi:histidine triad (HIT) family protein
MDCLFCRIARKEIPSEKIYEDDHVYGFKDIQPKADLHFLFIHKKHTADILEMTETDVVQLTQLFQGMASFVNEARINLKNPDYLKGFRIITNKGIEGGQTIFHTHFHLLSGQHLPW